MKIRRIYLGLVGLITGFLVALLKIYFKGAGTYQVDSLYDGVTNLIFLPLTAFAVLYFFDLKRLTISRMHLFGYYLLVILLITINQNMSHILFGSRPAKFLVGLLPSYIFYFIFFSIIIGFLSLFFWIFLLISKKRQLLMVALPWVFLLSFYCGIFFSDWGENLNIGGPSGKWYLYGDYCLVFGTILIFIFIIVNKWGRKKRKRSFS